MVLLRTTHSVKNKMVMIKKLACLLFAISGVTAFAQNEIVMLGAGTTSCNKFLEALKSSPSNEKEMLKSMFETWVKGYLSGRNKQLDSLGYKKVDLGSVTQLGDVLVVTCDNAVKQGYGTMPVSIVVDKVFEEAFDKKVRN